MATPNVTMRWCYRHTKCEWCSDPIEKGKPMVCVFFWNKGTPEHKGFNTKLYYHPECWIEQGLDYLKKNPYVPTDRRSLPPLTEEQRVERNKLLNRWSSLNQQIGSIRPDNPNRMLIEARLEVKKANLIVLIAPLGGVPKKWLEPNH